MNRYKALLSDTLVIGIGNFTIKIIYFFLMPIYTATLSAGEFGEADLLNNLVALLLPILTLSISEGLFRFVLDKNEDPNQLLSIGISIVSKSCIVSFLLTMIVYMITKQSYWIYFFLYFITESVRTIFAQFARGVGNVRDFSIAGIIAAVVLFISTYFLLSKSHLGVSGYLVAFIIANIFSILYLCFYVSPIRHFSWSYSSNKCKEILLYSLPLIPNTLSWWVTNISSRYILAYSCGIAVAGLFAATSKLPALINIVTSVFQQSWQISSVKESESGDSVMFYSKVFSVYSSLVFISGALIIQLIPVISKFVLQGDFYKAWVYTPLLLYSAIWGCFSVFFGNFYTIAKDSKSIMRTTIYGAIINVVLCLILIPIINIYGALIANALSFICVTVFRIFDTRKKMPIEYNKYFFWISFAMLLAETCLMTTGKTHFIVVSIVITCLIVLMQSYFLYKLKMRNK